MTVPAAEVPAAKMPRRATGLALLAAAAAFLLSLWPARAPAQTWEEVYDAAFVAVQRATANPAARALAAAATRAATADPALDALLRERDTILTRLGDTRDRQAALVLATGTDTEAALARMGESLAADSARLATLDAALDARFPDFRALRDPEPLSVAAVQALLGPGEALIFIASDDSRTITWAITPDTMDWARVAVGEDDLAAAVRLLRESLRPDAARAVETIGADTTIAPFDRFAAYDLYRDVLRPVSHVFRDSDHLLIVADGPLSSLPFSLLVTAPPEGADDSAVALATTDWLIRDHALTTLPSVPALATLRAGELRPQASRAFAGFGDPEVGRAPGLGSGAGTDGTGNGAVDSGDGLYADLAQWANLSPLPGTRSELTALAGLLGAAPETDLFMGAAATEARVKAADLSDVDIIAFATHGLLADSLPGLDEPALVFTPPRHASAVDDALLTASEAAALTLNASLIILSACDTAASDGTPGAQGLSGLAQAFIYAGARALLVSHWPVDDSAAARLTTGMIREMQDGAPRAQALRISTLALMDDAANPMLAHPRFWAPFVIVGEGWQD